MRQVEALACAMAGRSLRLEPPAPDWKFVTSDGGAALTAGFWRLRDPLKVLLTSEDHGHPFGLPAPVDCVREFARATRGAGVTGIVGDGRTGDLRIALQGDIVVELLCTSSGYECWEAHAGSIALVGRGDGIIDIGPTE